MISSLHNEPETNRISQKVSAVDVQEMNAVLNVEQRDVVHMRLLLGPVYPRSVWRCQFCLSGSSRLSLSKQGPFFVPSFSPIAPPTAHTKPTTISEFWAFGIWVVFTSQSRSELRLKMRFPLFRCLAFTTHRPQPTFGSKSVPGHLLTRLSNSMPLSVILSRSCSTSTLGTTP